MTQTKILRCGLPLAGGGGSCQAPANHEGLGHDLTGQPWAHTYMPLRERDHAEALAENAAHDAAMAKAQELTPELVQFLARPAGASTLPQRIRRDRRRPALSLVVPK